MVPAMKKTILGLALSLAAICVLSTDAFAGEKYVGTISPGALNITGTYDAGNLQSDGGCPTDGGPCYPPAVELAYTAPVGPGSLIALQTLGTACYCLNQIDANQVTNCSSSNCVTISPAELRKTSCPPFTNVKIAATLSDGGTAYGNTNLCTIYVTGDAGVRVFTRQGNE